MEKALKEFSRYDRLPKGETDDKLIPGCLILEGGGWRGLYTQGVLDAMMEEGIRLQTVIGVSAGAMSSLTYASGQIGLSAGINLKYRHDPDYCGPGALRSDHGFTGFRYFFKKILPECGYDWQRIPAEMRLVAVAANCFTGEAEYFEYGSCHFEKAVAASATVPFFSRPVVIRQVPYLDGGCADRVPYEWALREGYEKIVVVRTRHKEYRKKADGGKKANAAFYWYYPNLRRALDSSAERYNACLDRLYRDESEGLVYVQTPEEPVHVRRFEGDMEKLGGLYETGYREMKERMPDLKRYLFV